MQNPLEVLPTTEPDDEVLRGMAQNRHGRIINIKVAAKMLPNHRWRDCRPGATDHRN
jgi:hypothetical protein